MNSTEILKLIEAGYTKSDIDAMNQAPAAEPEETPAAEPEETPAAEPEQEPQPEPASNEMAEVKEQLQETQKQLQDLIRQMQRNNLKTASVNIRPEDDLMKRTDEALAELIRPKFEGSESK